MSTTVSSFLLIVIISIAISVPAAVGIYFVLSSLDKQPTPQPIPQPEPKDNQTIPPITCGNGTQLVNGTCIPIVVPPVVVNETIPQPEPEPQPTPTPPQPTPQPTTESKLIVVADIYGAIGKEVGAEIKSRNADLVMIAGDLGYDNDGDYLKQVYGPLGNKVACTIGNHDEGIVQLEQYCGNDYYIKLDSTLILGLNTDGTLTTQATRAKALLENDDFMKGIKSVHIVTHKPCATPANSHHAVESDVKALCDIVKTAALTNNVKLFFDNGHNHNLAEGIAADGTVYHTSGGGGRGTYDCGSVTGIWKFCVEDYGFLEYVIKSDGSTTWKFYNEDGVIIK